MMCACLCSGQNLRALSKSQMHEQTCLEGSSYVRKVKSHAEKFLRNVNPCGELAGENGDSSRFVCSWLLVTKAWNSD